MIKIHGTQYRLHPMFILVMLTSILSGNIGELITLFTIVFIHEMGHVVAAKNFGWEVKSVQLLPFGGVAEVETHRNTSAKEEIIVAAAGPLQNCWMIALVYLLQRTEMIDLVWSEYFIQANLMIALFNLLPILPLDGGKIVQALLSYKISYHNSLKYCAWNSLLMSVLIIAYACMDVFYSGVHLNLLVIGFFLLYSNWYYFRNIPYSFIRFLINRELTFANMKEKKETTKPIFAKSSSSISEIVRCFKRDQMHIIYVLNDLGKVQAVIPEKRIIQTYLNPKIKG
ncbi:M50 family metallopeptidase [Chengkuizengella sp. SCS-71B]|uniref:M50 family metallopeptidase n=1 Tax=Chengkuizengella sp. SCS-71B TaxID=3115290 RepID=UPI0032C22554